MDHNRLLRLIARTCPPRDYLPAQYLHMIFQAQQQLTQRWPLAGCGIELESGKMLVIPVGRN